MHVFVGKRWGKINIKKWIINVCLALPVSWAEHCFDVVEALFVVEHFFLCRNYGGKHH